VVAIAGDPLPKLEGLAKKYPSITFLADATGLPVSQAWQAAAPDDDVPTPVVYVIDTKGVVVFTHHSARDKGEWPAWETLFAALK
jgi:hypothetical protein